MRIAFCGASGTGKTTLAHWLANELGYLFNPVGSRNVATNLGFSNPYDVDKSSYQAYKKALERGDSLTDCADHAWWEWHESPGQHESCRVYFQHKLQQAKIDWETGKNDFVTDRTTVDDFVYCALHGVRGVNETFMDRAEAWTKSYDLIFFCTTKSFHNIAGDVNRIDDLAYHKVFELFCDGALVNWLGNDWNETVVYVEDKLLFRRKTEVLEQVKAKEESMKKLEKK